MNKTVIISIAIVMFGLNAMFYVYSYSSKTETRDRLTVCLQTIMSESRLSGKPIDAEKARAICS